MAIIYSPSHMSGVSSMLHGIMMNLVSSLSRQLRMSRCGTPPMAICRLMLPMTRLCEEQFGIAIVAKSYLGTSMVYGYGMLMMAHSSIILSTNLPAKPRGLTLSSKSLHGGDDEAVYFWDAQSGDVLKTFFHDDQLLAASIKPFQRSIVDH